jgi:hypothetical protein
MAGQLKIVNFFFCFICFIFFFEVLVGGVSHQMAAPSQSESNSNIAESTYTPMNILVTGGAGFMYKFLFIS